MSRVVSAGVSYFGKVPSRGDFVRAADNHQLLGWLDRWAGESVELLSQNPDWKRVYDDSPEIHYAFLGSRSKLVLCGHFLPSRDASQRRFPLLSAVRLEATEPLPFIGRSPLAMSNAWSGLSRMARRKPGINACTGSIMASKRHERVEKARQPALDLRLLDGQAMGQALLAQP